MGYAFEIVGMAGGTSSFAMNGSQMSLMNEFMREVGAISEPGRQRALDDGPPVDPGAAQSRNFSPTAVSS